MTEISASDLHPCDVLLYQGTGILSHLIMLLDGGHFSHAGIYDGREVVEAIAEGVKDRPLFESVAGAKRVEVFRFRKDGHHLEEAGWPSDPIVEKADEFVGEGERYAYEEILLLAPLAAARQIPLDPWTKRLLREVLDLAAGLVAKIVSLGHEPMICSELVYRSFDEAERKRKYTLRIRGLSLARAIARSVGRRPSRRARPLDKDTAAFEQSRARFLEAFVAARRGGKRRIPSAAGRRAAAIIVPDFVTPKDLETSGDLEGIGTLRL